MSDIHIIVDFYDVTAEPGDDSVWQMNTCAVPRVGERCLVHAYVERGCEPSAWKDWDLPRKLEGVVERVEWTFESRSYQHPRHKEMCFAQVFIRPDTERE